MPAGSVTGVGAGALPGWGSGYAVVVALWNVTLPSVLVNSWCTCPLRQVTEENRRIQQRFREVAEQARLAQRSVSVVILDLDHFKELNDTHGHAHGDAVLREVAYLLRKELRAFELLYRIGGEELLLVLPGADLTETIDIAERVRAEIEAAKPGGLTITASFGVCSAAPDQLEFDRIFRAADEALYAAKHAGRNLVAYIPPDQSGPTVAQRETVAA